MFLRLCVTALVAHQVFLLIDIVESSAVNSFSKSSPIVVYDPILSRFYQPLKIDQDIAGTKNTPNQNFRNLDYNNQLRLQNLFINNNQPRPSIDPRDPRNEQIQVYNNNNGNLRKNNDEESIGIHDLRPKKQRLVFEKIVQLPQEYQDNTKGDQKVVQSKKLFEKNTGNDGIDLVKSSSTKKLNLADGGEAHEIIRRQDDGDEGADVENYEENGSENQEDSKYEESKHPVEKKYEEGGSEEAHSGHHGESGEKKEEGYKSWHEHEEGKKGHHDKEGHDHSYEEKGGKKKKHHEEDEHESKHEKGEKGEKESHFGENGKFSKGHSTKGHHVVHKKDDYEKNVEFFDESHEEDGSEKGDEFFHEYKHKKGHSEKKGHHDGASHEDKYGKKGEFKKGEHFHEEKDHDNSEGHEDFHEHESKYGKKGGEDEGKKWSYSKKKKD